VITAHPVQLPANLAATVAALDNWQAHWAQQAGVIARAIAASPRAKQQRAHSAKTAANLAALIESRRSLRQVAAETCTPSAPRNLTARTPDLVLTLHQGNAPPASRHSTRARGAALI